MARSDGAGDCLAQRREDAVDRTHQRELVRRLDLDLAVGQRDDAQGIDQAANLGRPDAIAHALDHRGPYLVDRMADGPYDLGARSQVSLGHDASRETRKAKSRPTCARVAREAV